jgi:hypothetical protein
MDTHTWPGTALPRLRAGDATVFETEVVPENSEAVLDESAFMVNGLARMAFSVALYLDQAIWRR